MGEDKTTVRPSDRRILLRSFWGVIMCDGRGVILRRMDKNHNLNPHMSPGILRIDPETLDQRDACDIQCVGHWFVDRAGGVAYERPRARRADGDSIGTGSTPSGGGKPMSPIVVPDDVKLKQLGGCVTMGVRKCSSCGRDHAQMVFQPLDHPDSGWTHWAACPTSGKEIRMKAEVDRA